MNTKTIQVHKLFELIGGIMLDLHEFKLKRFEAKMKKLKPKLLEKWYNKQYEEIDNKLHDEYEEELERLGDSNYKLNKDLTDAHKQAELYKHKYEAAMETQDKLINKVEKASTAKGQLKQEVNTLKTTLQETTEETE